MFLNRFCVGWVISFSAYPVAGSGPFQCLVSDARGVRKFQNAFKKLHFLLMDLLKHVTSMCIEMSDFVKISTFHLRMFMALLTLIDEYKLNTMSINFNIPRCSYE